MLRGIRKASGTVLGWVMMAVVIFFLIISFGIWGIGDIFRTYGRSTLARVGSTEIGVEQFRQTYNERLQLLGRRVGRPITPDQARALGLDRQLLGQIIAEAALDERARQLKLNLSDTEIIRQITNDPNFRGPTGQFDRLRFEQIIRTAGFNEARYVAEQRRVALRHQIADAVSGLVTPPTSAADALNQYENEERSIEYVVLERSQAGEIAAPTPEVLSQYFEARKSLFRAPEFRKIALLVVSAADLAARIDVPDADAKRFYDDHLDRYGSPERRQVQQIVFSNAEDAAAAADRIAKGTPFATIAAERGLKEQDIDLGLVTKSGIFDRALADAAFSLAEGATSAPIAGRFGATLIHVVKIEPGKTKQFEEAAAEIKHEIALDRAKAQILDLHDKIEDERGSGMHLDEVAKKLKLDAHIIDAVDRSGRDASGTPVADLPAGVDVVAAVFSSDVNVDNDPLQLTGGGFAWFDVLAVTPSRERGLDEVKDKVEAQWRDDQVAQRLAAKAAEMVDKLKAAETAFADVVGALKPQAASGLKRGRASGTIPVKAVAEVFGTAKGAPGAVEGNDPTERMVFRVTDIKVPAFDAASADGKRLIEQLNRSFADELFGQYLARLETDLGVTINEDALRGVIGGEAN